MKIQMKKLLSGMTAAIIAAGSILLPAAAGAEAWTQTEKDAAVLYSSGEGQGKFGFVIKDGPKLEGDKVTINLQGPNSYKAVFVAVSKENGRLKRISYAQENNFSEGRILSVDAPTTEEYELLLWNSLEEMVPLMPAVTTLEGLPYVPGRNTSLEDSDSYTSADNSTFMVKEVVSNVSDKGNTFYTVKATANGEEVEYVTSAVTSVSKSVDNIPIFGSVRRYSYELLWDAVSAREGKATVQFEDIVKPGDVFSAQKDGNTLLYMLKTGDASQIGRNQNVNWSNTGGLSQRTQARDGWTFGGVKRMNYIATDPDVSDSVVSIETGLQDNYTFILSVSKKMDLCEITYEIDKTGQTNIIRQTIAEDAVTPKDLVVYDEAKGTGDMVLTRIFRNGIRENYVYRFKQVFARDTSLEEDSYTAEDNSTFMVKKVSRGIDEEGNPVYWITATTNGLEVKYVTSTVTSLSKSEDDKPVFSSTRRYSYELLWDAVSARDGIATAQFEDIVKPGDVFTAKKNGNTLLYMHKIGDYSYIGRNGNVNWTNTGKMSQGSLTRDGWTFGQVKHVNIDEIVSVVTGFTEDYTLGLDPSKMMDVYEITYETRENGERCVVTQELAKDAVTPEELVVYDETTGEGDMLLTRVYRGNIRENYVYRFIKKASE